MEIKDAVYKKFGFTVNVGISVNRLLAKMASDFEKPNKVHTLFPEEIPLKMWPLPVSELYMAGRSSVEVLHKLEIRTIGELAKADPALLEIHLKSHGRTLWEFANGKGSSKVIREHVENKGIGNSTTLAKDADNLTDIHEVLLTLSDSVAKRLREADSMAYMVSVEVKYNTFVKNSHQTTLMAPTNTSNTIYQTACRLFDELWDGTPVRLLGIRTSKLVATDEPVQLNLMDYMTQSNTPSSRLEKSQKLDAALDSIRNRYGTSAVIRGSMLKKQGDSKD